MKYINPYEIADFLRFDGLNIDTFKKFKKRLSVELELNDDEITVNNVLLQKNEIYEILDNIDRNKSLLDIYKSLYENQELNDFLNEQLNITDIKKLKNILFLENKEIINFITPYLIDIFSKLYKEAFLKNDINILEIEPPLNKSNYGKVYEPIYKILKNKENELIDLKDEYYDLNDIKNIIGDIKTINVLPEYFTKIRSDIAYAIRSLSIDSWNDNENLDLAIDLIDYALKLNTNKETRNKFLSDKGILLKIKKEQDLMKYLTTIEDILNNNSISFSTKIDKIINILRSKNNEIEDNNIALIVYNMIDKYIEEHKSIIQTNLSSLIKIFNFLLKISNDTKFNRHLNENINILNKLQKAEKEKTIESFSGVIISVVVIIGALIGVVNGGFDGLFTGIIIGGIISYLINEIYLDIFKIKEKK